MKSIYIFSLVVLLSSCSPQTRLNNLVNRYPELANIIDTIHINDTIYTPSIALDTLVNVDSNRDSLVYNWGTLYFSINESKLRLQMRTYPDTIIRKHTVTSPRFSVHSKKLNTVQKGLQGVGLTTIILIIIFLIYKSK